MQSMRPCTEWQGCTPVLMEDLYSSILEGRLDLLVPLANGQAPERTTVLRHLVAMPAQQHLQLQVLVIPAHYSITILLNHVAQRH